jgi:hypothetical protein
MVLTRKLRENWLRLLTHIGALTPLALLAWDYWGGHLSVNPIQDITLLDSGPSFACGARWGFMPSCTSVCIF